MPIAYYQTPVGVARIIEDEDFITSISILDDKPEVKPVESPLLKSAIEQLNEYFGGERKVFDLPLRQSGTEFQQKVWDQLLKIDYGTTISYLQQSKLMNNPLGIRAIAAANGKNSLWVVVPCHRVIGSDGSLTGYAGGLWRKQWLLAHEARIMGVGQIRLDF
jgi:methylated-DNA-[protein]-cysteine S-methyltransferase